MSLLERLGNAVGPLIAGVLVLKLGYQPSFIAIGATVTLCGVLFLAVAHRSVHLKFNPA